MRTIKTAILFATLCLASSLAEKEVKIVSINQLNAKRTGTLYDLDTNVTGLADDAKLLTAMEKAQSNGEMTFNGTNSVQYGFLVTMIDGVEADSTQNQYWEILGGADMAPLPLGVSSYVPADREKVLFRLVTWNGEVDDGHADTEDGISDSTAIDAGFWIDDSEGDNSGSTVIDPGFWIFTYTHLVFFARQGF